MKTLAIFGIIALSIIGLFKWRFRKGTTPQKDIIAEFTEGNDRLTLCAVYTSNWGNSYAARTLSFNDRLVDFQGSLYQKTGDGHKIMPLDIRGLHINVLDPENAETLHDAAILLKNATFLSGTVPYDMLQKIFPSLENGIPWTVWINPKEFSSTEFERITAMLSKYAWRMHEAQQAYESDTTRRVYAWQRFPTLVIWRAVYHDFDALENEVFERKQGETLEKITITPQGGVLYYQKSKQYEFGFGMAMGQLNDSADTLFISPDWNTVEVNFPPEELADFRDVQGRLLGDKYRIVSMPDIAEPSSQELRDGEPSVMKAQKQVDKPQKNE